MAQNNASYEIRMKPQGEVLDGYMMSRKRVSFIMGPLGSGKTYQSCQKILKLMIEQRLTLCGLELCAMKVARTVLRGLPRGNAGWLLD